MLRSKKITGFTLIEILIVLGIMTLILGILLSTFVNFKNKEALEKDTILVAEVLRQAKHLTFNSKNSNQYGVHFNLNSIVLFVGPTYSAGSPTNEVYNFNPDIILYNTNITGGGSDIVFKKLTGDTNNNGTITLKSKIASTTKSISIYSTGLIE